MTTWIKTAPERYRLAGTEYSIAKLGFGYSRKSPGWAVIQPDGATMPECYRTRGDCQTAISEQRDKTRINT